MGIEYSDLAKAQLRDIVAYTKIEFGNLVAKKVRTRLQKDVARLSSFFGISQIDFVLRGHEIHRMVSGINVIYYMEYKGKVYVLAIFDSRMSPQMMKATLRGNIPE